MLRRLSRCLSFKRRNLLSGRLLRPAFHQLAQLKFELVQQNGGALGGISEPGVPEFGDLELEVLDLGIEIAGAGFGFGGAPVLFDQHRFQQRNIAGKLCGIEKHAHHDSCFAFPPDRGTAIIPQRVLCATPPGDLIPRSPAATYAAAPASRCLQAYNRAARARSSPRLPPGQAR